MVRSIMDKDGITPITLGGRMIALSIRRHRLARRISLRLSPARDAVVMTLPVRASVEAGMKFVASKESWLLSMVEPDGAVLLSEGAKLPILGEHYTLLRLPGRGVGHLEAGELRLHCAEAFLARRVRDFLKKRLRDYCHERAVALAGELGKAVREVKIRDLRSRWGSCSARRVLTFHWQLIFAPLPVLDYLIAHEVAHLQEMNHSARFWSLVKRFAPDHATARDWLKRNGHTLHRYGA